MTPLALYHALGLSYSPNHVTPGTKQHAHMCTTTSSSQPGELLPASRAPNHPACEQGCGLSCLLLTHLWPTRKQAGSGESAKALAQPRGNKHGHDPHHSMQCTWGQGPHSRKTSHHTTDSNAIVPQVWRTSGLLDTPDWPVACETEPTANKPSRSHRRCQRGALGEQHSATASHCQQPTSLPVTSPSPYLSGCGSLDSHSPGAGCI